MEKPGKEETFQTLEESYANVLQKYAECQALWADIQAYFDDKKKKKPVIKSRLWVIPPKEIQKKKELITQNNKVISSFGIYGAEYLDDKRRVEFITIQRYCGSLAQRFESEETEMLYLYTHRRNVRDRVRIKKIADDCKIKNALVIDILLGIYLIWIYSCVRKTNWWAKIYKSQPYADIRKMEKLLFDHTRNNLLIKQL